MALIPFSIPLKFPQRPRDCVLTFGATKGIETKLRSSSVASCERTSLQPSPVLEVVEELAMMRVKNLNLPLLHDLCRYLNW